MKKSPYETVVQPALIVRLATTLLIGTIALPSALAVNDRTWNGSISTDWATGGNWTPTGAPGSGNTTIINSGTVVHSSGVDQTRDFLFGNGILNLTGGSITSVGFNTFVGTASGTATVTISTGGTLATGNTNQIQIGTTTSVGTIVLSGGTVNTDVLTVRQAAGATGTVRGFGTVAAGRTDISLVVNNGRIIADGGTLNMTAFSPSRISSNIENTTNNGWYAINGGRITTGSTGNLSVGTGTVIWGESSGETASSLDLVNSVALTYNVPSGVGQVNVSLLANDYVSAHAAPSGVSFIGYWDITSGGTISLTDLAFRYDNVLAGVNTPTLYFWNGSSWDALSTSVTGNIADYNGGSSLSFGNYALGVVPEPATAALLGVGLVGLMARRRSRMLS